MDIRTERKDAFKVIGMTLSVLLHDERKKKLITTLHDDFNDRVHEVKNRVNTKIGYGIFIDPPNYNPETDPFTWIAGVEVDDVSNPPEGMRGFEFPEQLYVVTSYEGPNGEAGNLYGALYNWVRQSDYQIAGDYGVEVYSDDNEELDPNEIRMELCLPIEKRVQEK
ncbi:GyrI-like domain-containing protein [Sporosarcina highlanderae]|uniref:GyrI-like domain-containing protein n=1 Tax=Sporosarcina highlanderae TaxID=3035916 RepID=A0ABT8JMI7_9BACL|nr:GyrI-like domain-containing protein [Sporosarcina highlanderae]MDN4606289.1 GyrI-like domain-containing protein [Sporosarcina highlanderae]